jgi:hypothetical protein
MTRCSRCLAVSVGVSVDVHEDADADADADASCTPCPLACVDRKVDNDEFGADTLGYMFV